MRTPTAQFDTYFLPLLQSVTRPETHLAPSQASTHEDKSEICSSLRQTDSSCGSVKNISEVNLCVRMACVPIVAGGLAVSLQRRAPAPGSFHPTSPSPPVTNLPSTCTTSRTHTITAPPNQRTTRVVKRLWEGVNGWNNNRNGRGFDSPPAK